VVKISVSTLFYMGQNAVTLTFQDIS
jgi:hypothetical protein